MSSSQFPLEIHHDQWAKTFNCGKIWPPNRKPGKRLCCLNLLETVSAELEQQSLLEICSWRSLSAKPLWTITLHYEHWRHGRRYLDQSYVPWQACSLVLPFPTQNIWCHMHAKRIQQQVKASDGKGKWGSESQQHQQSNSPSPSRSLKFLQKQNDVRPGVVSRLVESLWKKWFI